MYHVTKGSQWDPLNCLFAREGLREGALGSYVVQWHYPLGSMLMPVQVLPGLSLHGALKQREKNR